MPKSSLSVRLRARLAADPVLANRVLRLLGRKRLAHIGQRAAIRAARNAYHRVPYYRRLYEAHGLDAARMARLDWKTFLSLPTANKSSGIDLPDEDLLDSSLTMPIDDALIGRSSGTTRKPVAWPLSWDDYALLRATFRANLLELRADREKTAVMLLMGAEGVEYAGNTMYRVMFSIKEETHWPMEVFLTGDNVAEIAALLKWIVQRGYTSMFMISFPGTYERMLDLLAADPEAVGMWERITRKKVISGGQLVSKRLRDRLTTELGLPRQDLMAIEVLYISSDSGQTIARTTAFSAYVQRCLDARPALYDTLGLDAEHRVKPLLEFVPPLSLLVEPNTDGDGGALLTVWKHRPLIRYESNDLLWMRPARELVRMLNREVPGWRREFRKLGYGRAYVPSTAMLGVVLGRTDDIRIVNGANISPDILRQALELAGILPHIHHFKHDTDSEDATSYLVYLELPDATDDARLRQLEDEWRPELLATMLNLPGVGLLLPGPHEENLNLRVIVRSRGTGEFAGDDERPKRPYVPRRGA